MFGDHVFLGAVLIDHILEIFKEYGLSPMEVLTHVIFLTDRGANIKYGLINAGYRRLTCYAHIIHNLVSAIIGETKVSSIVDKCATLSSYMKNHGLNKNLRPTLKRYTPTRWNSVYIMIDCIIKSYGPAYDILIAKQVIV